jgi:hypothetical protein
MNSSTNDISQIVASYIGNVHVQEIYGYFEHENYTQLMNKVFNFLQLMNVQVDVLKVMSSIDDYYTLKYYGKSDKKN